MQISVFRNFKPVNALNNLGKNMKISNTLYFTPVKYQQKQQTSIKNNNQTLPQNTTNSNKIYAYRYFAINFTGRSPEDFNRYNIERNRMPVTMKEFLMADYDKRKIIPPQQVMEKVYEHLKDDDVKSVLDVKKKYPNEPLFNNLHEPKIKPRTSILSEIEVVKELGEAPLIKDGNNDFGLYLLRKIYLEGKSENEINKDFYEKDLNDEYKGIVNKEITNGDFRAYGIKFPVVPFWNSFLHTREEYKKFRIDMSQFEDKETSTSSKQKATSGSHSTQNTHEQEIDKTPKKRKYTIKKYQQDQLKREISNSDMTETDIEKKIRKRFSKDDPEASFIIKYLSPIMTVAADKIHLSEEEKYFAEFEKDNPVSGKTMFERFWKANPELRKLYSQAITDTIETFEDVYGGGGNLPINSNLEVITPSTENQKIIDFVNPEFIELLNYTQDIGTLREKRYAEHDALQAQWEEHFLNRYGEPKTQETPETTPTEPPANAKTDTLSVQEAMEKEALKNPGVKIYQFKLSNGSSVSILANTKEVLENRIADEYRHMPTSFARRFAKFILNHPKATEDYLLAFSCNLNNLMENSRFVADSDNHTQEELDRMNELYIEEVKKQMMSADEVYDIYMELYSEFEEKNPNYIKVVKQALGEYSTRLKTPDEKYLKALITERYRQLIEDAGVESGLSEEEIERAKSTAYAQALTSIKSMQSHDIALVSTKYLESGLAFLSIGNDIENQQSELDKIMNKYQRPLTNSEMSKILHTFTNILTNMKSNDTTNFKGELSSFFNQTVENLKNKNNSKYKKLYMEALSKNIITADNTTLRYLLEKNADKNLVEAIVEREFSEALRIPGVVEILYTMNKTNIQQDSLNQFPFGDLYKF